MRMNQQKQKWLVLLFSLMELDGGGQRKDVLSYIQESGYWYKNDSNDSLRSSRNEKSWRNDFSFECQHLVEQGYMQPHLKRIWKITPAGREYVASQAEMLHGVSTEALPCITAVFWLKFFRDQTHSDAAADQILLEQLALEEDAGQEQPLPPLLDAPLPKGPCLHGGGNQRTYPRDPAVARRALARAGYRCEIDCAHTSFLRKNGDHLYMEPHHLIPLSHTDAFGVSLDREQNIVSLCSNCHNQIHYGRKEDVRALLSQLFQTRQEPLSAILGHPITLEDLFRVYDVL